MNCRGAIQESVQQALKELACCSSESEEKLQILGRSPLSSCSLTK